MIIPDVNLLLYAYDTSAPAHARAAEWWQECLSGTESIGLLAVVAFGFIRISTHHRVYRHPLAAREAVGLVRSWRERTCVEWLEMKPNHLDAALGLIERQGVAGNLVTDLQIAAMAIAHHAVLHSNDTDFLRFDGLRWFNPLSINGSSARRGK